MQLRLEEEAKRIEEEAKEEKEKVQLRLEEEAKRIEEEVQKEKEKVQLRLEEAKRSVMEEEKMMKMKVEDSDILRGGVADLQEGEEGALMHNNPGSSSSLPHCASQNEESSLSQRSGYSKACDMLLTASTAIASPSAAVLLGSNFKHGGSKASHYNNDEEVQQTKALSSRRMTGRKSKRNEGQEADNISSLSAELITPVTDRKDDSPSDLITEVDNTVHRGKRAKTVKILPSSAVIETQATSTSTSNVRSAKRTVESTQASHGNNESEANDQQSQTSRIEGSAKGKKTVLGDTERLSTSSTSQSLLTGDRLDHGEKDEKIQKDDENPVRIINTGLLYGEEEFEELARACGAVVAALPCNATHIVTTDTIKRTPKVGRRSMK